MTKSNKTSSTSGANNRNDKFEKILQHIDEELTKCARKGTAEFGKYILNKNRTEFFESCLVAPIEQRVRYSLVEFKSIVREICYGFFRAGKSTRDFESCYDTDDARNAWNKADVVASKQRRQFTTAIQGLKKAVAVFNSHKHNYYAEMSDSFTLNLRPMEEQDIRLAEEIFAAAESWLIWDDLLKRDPGIFRKPLVKGGRGTVPGSTMWFWRESLLELFTACGMNKTKAQEVSALIVNCLGYENEVTSKGISQKLKKIK